MTLCGIFFPPFRNTLSYNHVPIILISLLFWVRGNPNPDAVGKSTLTCRGGTDPTRQAAAITPPCRPLVSSTLSSAQLLLPLARLPAGPFPCLLARPPLRFLAPPSHSPQCHACTGIIPVDTLSSPAAAFLARGYAGYLLAQGRKRPRWQERPLLPQPRPPRLSPQPGSPCPPLREVFPITAAKLIQSWPRRRPPRPGPPSRPAMSPHVATARASPLAVSIDNPPRTP